MSRIVVRSRGEQPAMFRSFIQRCLMLRKHRLILAGALVYLSITNVVWILYDTRPPFWDMAYHSSSALRVYEAFEENGVRAIALVPFRTGFYPPLVPSVVAAAWAIFGKTIPVSRLINLAALAVLLGATFGIGKRFLSPVAAATPAVLAVFFPIMIWLSRETIQCECG
jgi:4-amino-4-deoxy-L-arabinose transferase-like glycosyltransferase